MRLISQAASHAVMGSWLKVLSLSWRVSLLCFSQAGGFYSAEDADSYPTTTSREKREGAFCVWTAEELRALLPDPVQGATEGTTLADVFMHHYGVEEAGNVDPMKVKESKDLPGALVHGIHRHEGMAEQPQNTQSPTPPKPNGIPVCLPLLSGPPSGAEGKERPDFPLLPGADSSAVRAGAGRAEHPAAGMPAQTLLSPGTAATPAPGHQDAGGVEW